MPAHLVIEDPKWLEYLDSTAEAEHWVGDVCWLALRSAPNLQDLEPAKREELELSVALVQNNRMQGLNNEFREKDAPTNVLSFPAFEDIEQMKRAVMQGGMREEEAKYLGDLILARETIEQEAKEQGKEFKDHFAHLLVHGCLHLLGYNHIADDEAEEMEGLEVVILKELSVANPYE